MTPGFRLLVLLHGDNLRLGLSFDEAMSIPPAAGEAEVVFLPGLVRLSPPSREVQLASYGLSGGDQVSLTVALDVLDLWALRNAGTRIQAMEIYVYAYSEEATLADAVELYRGELRAPVFDLDAGTVDLTAGEPLEATDLSFPPTTVDLVRFPDAHEGSLGSTIPVVYGLVRGVPLVTLRTDGVDTEMLIAGHRICGNPLAPGTVDVFRPPENPDGPGEEVLAYASRTIYSGRDALGGTYAFVKIPAIGWKESTFFTGDLLGHVGANDLPIDRLGDVLDHMLRTYGRDDWRRYDKARMRAAQAALNRFGVGVLVNDREQGETMLSIIQHRLAPQYPVIFGAVAGRIGWDAALIPDDPEAPPALELTYGVNIFARTALSESSRAEVRNRFELEWSVKGSTGKANRTATRDAETDDRCRASQTRWGRSPIYRLSAADCSDEATAALLLDEQIRRLFEVRDTIGYTVVETTVLRLPSLAVVAVTDPACEWTRRRFLLVSVVPDVGGTIAIGLLGLSPSGQGPGIQRETATIAVGGGGAFVSGSG